jgi:lipoprotein-releasing system ATP-binding protein
MPAATVIRAEGVVKGYRTRAGYLPILQDLEIRVAEGEMVAVVGASGVGKSTLLHVLGTLDRPEAGAIEICGDDVFSHQEAALRRFRNRTLGFVFQFHHLLPEFTALENVMMPLRIARQPEAEARRRDHRPSTLSGGEQQRVAVARALAQSPRVLLADEPTGNLDRATGDRLHELLRRLNRERGLTVVAVTHNPHLAGLCDRALTLEGGRLHPSTT